MTKRSKKDMLKLYQRHLGKCELPMSALDKCECVYWVRGWLRGKPVRVSLNTRSLAMADLKRKSMLDPEPEPPSGGGPRLVGGKLKPDADKITLEWAQHEYKTANKGKMTAGTIDNYDKDIRRFRLFAEAYRVIMLHQVTTEVIERFFAEHGSQWNLRTKRQKLVVIRIFFKHAKTKKWILDSPADDPGLSFDSPKQAPRLPFNEAQIKTIGEAIDTLEDPVERARARALIYLMLFAGQRISDAVFCERGYINTRSELDYFCIKTGRRIGLPPKLQRLALDALKALPPSRTYFFVPDRDDDYYEARHVLRSGEGDFAETLPKGVYNNSISRARYLVHKVMMRAGFRQDHRKEAKVARARRVRIGYAGLCHRFRDTFAINLLVKGVDIFSVSKFLGHLNVKTTEDHYLKLIDGYQERMSAKTDLLDYPLSA